MSFMRDALLAFGKQETETVEVNAPGGILQKIRPYAVVGALIMAMGGAVMGAGMHPANASGIQSFRHERVVQNPDGAALAANRAELRSIMSENFGPDTPIANGSRDRMLISDALRQAQADFRAGAQATKVEVNREARNGSLAVTFREPSGQSYRLEVNLNGNVSRRAEPGSTVALDSSRPHFASLYEIPPAWNPPAAEAQTEAPAPRM